MLEVRTATYGPGIDQSQHTKSVSHIIDIAYLQSNCNLILSKTQRNLPKSIHGNALINRLMLTRLSSHKKSYN